MKLSELLPGGVGRVVAIAEAQDLEAKLREVGFSEGDEVEMLTHGPFGGRTIAVRLNRSIIALRGAEAELIRIEEVS